MVVTELEKQLRTVAKSWRTAMYEIGQLLNELRKAGEPTDQYRSHILSGEFGMPMSMSLVAMRWASGEFGRGKQADMLVRKVPSSVLAEMDSETAEALATKPQTIFSPPEGRMTTKRLADMNRQEITHNVTANGVRPAKIEDKPHRSCTASGVVREDGKLYITVGGASPLRIRLPAKIIEQLEAELAVPV